MSTLMTWIMVHIMQYCPFIITLANNQVTGATDVTEINTPSFLSNALGLAAGIGGALIAIFLIYCLVRDGLDFAKGQGSGSIWKIIGKTIFLIIILGLIYVATAYNSLGNKAKTIGNNGINTITNEVDDLLK